MNNLVKVTVIVALSAQFYLSYQSDCVQSKHGIELSSSLDDSNRTAACPGEAVVYTCTVANTGVLQWAVESFHRLEENSILLSVQYDPVGTLVQEQGGLLAANITDITQSTAGYWGNITSTLTIVANKNYFENRRVWCGNGFELETESPCIFHRYGVPPSSPVYPVYTVTSYEVSSFSVLLKWSKPQSDGGLGILNYTTTLKAPQSHYIYYVEMGEELRLNLLYMQLHSLQIVATNCAGKSPAINISILEVSCGPLDVSGTSTNNGENRVSTQKGSRLQYKCIDNAEVIVFECLSNGSWTPDPRVIKCSNISSFAKYVSSGGDFYTFILLCTHSDIIHCKAPVLPQNSHIDEERSIMGLMMVYQCNIGYKPTERTVSKCLATGEWAHNISDLQCIKQVDCGALMGLSNGFVDYAETMEGSVAILQCDKGLALLRDDLYVIKCNNNGTWMPNIFGQRCVDPLLKTGESCAGQSGNFYLIVGGTALLTSIPFGILVGWLLSKCRKRKQKNCQHSYEEVTPKRQQETIDIVQNEAYMKYQHNI